MINKLTLAWLYAASIRALRTIAQTALGMFTVGKAINEIDWYYILSVSLVAGLYSMLTSVATNLPEVGTDGTLQIDTSNPVKDTYLLTLADDLDNLATKKTVTFTVDSNANLSTSTSVKS
jgi:hypothetical protein